MRALPPQAPSGSALAVALAFAVGGVLGILGAAALFGCGRTSLYQGEPCDLSTQTYTEVDTVISTCPSQQAAVGTTSTGVVVLDPAAGDCQGRSVLFDSPGSLAWTHYDLSSSPAIVTLSDAKCTTTLSAVLTPRAP
jgi:hypothetical protein